MHIHCTTWQRWCGGGGIADIWSYLLAAGQAVVAEMDFLDLLHTGKAQEAEEVLCGAATVAESAPADTTTA